MKRSLSREEPPEGGAPSPMFFDRLKRTSEINGIIPYVDTMSSQQMMSEEDVFTPPKKTARASPAVPPTPTKVTNSFAVLERQTNMEIEESASAPRNIQANTLAIKKCPPITITQKIHSYSEFHQQLKSILQHKYHIRYNKDEVKVTTTEVSDYHQLISSLKKEKMEFFTYTPREETTKKMVVKAGLANKRKRAPNFNRIEELKLQKIVKKYQKKL